MKSSFCCTTHCITEVVTNPLDPTTLKAKSLNTSCPSLAQSAGRPPPPRYGHLGSILQPPSFRVLIFGVPGCKITSKCPWHPPPPRPPRLFSAVVHVEHHLTLGGVKHRVGLLVDFRGELSESGMARSWFQPLPRFEQTHVLLFMSSL